MSNPLIGADEAHREMVALRGEAVRQSYGDAVRQVFVANEYGNAQPVGSSVLLRVRDKSFLLTASHVLEHNAVSTLYLGGNPELIQIDGGSRRTGSEKKFVDDQLDIGFVELTPEAASNLGPVRYLMPQELDPDDSAEQMRLYVALGFPWRKTKTDRTTRTAYSPMMSVTAPSDSELFAKLQVEDLSHVVIPFDRESILLNGIRQTAPNPQGMSGGGLWRSDHVAFYAHRKPVGKLVGILTHYRDRGIKHIKATRISVVLEAIRMTYPDLDTDLPRAKRLRAKINERG